VDTVILYLPDCSAPAIVAAADQAVELLSDAWLRQKTVEHSFQVGQQHLLAGVPAGLPGAADGGLRRGRIQAEERLSSGDLPSLYWAMHECMALFGTRGKNSKNLSEKVDCRHVGW